MGDTGSSSILVHILVVALCLTAFGFAVAAERRRSTGSIVTDSSNATFCVYDSDIATGYGVGAFLFLLSGHSLLMGVTRCMCFGAPLAPGGSRAWSIIYFASSWITFAVAEACLIAGATKNAYHTKYRDMVYAGNWTCQTLRKGVFIAGAVFVVFTMILDVYFYMYYSKATSQATKRISKTTPSVGMTGYA
ncbi:hypothetical protein Zm00014a_036867 [Zea mays]|uniref:Fiber protein Fb34 n=2 Tax=Zea mays TaxID=4577 RepID=B4FVT6_MAIZE|nr:fiber protein Fb34 precursor [Zea mays]ACF86229.1 unknown [Zea mays]ACG32841.1 fiber protein Fb34 [Zea mays]PWZ17099.1 hypothetical protein Zm00014a_036867 [Zea mays]|eukprot:NP_001148769.1 fiber protein Fb34 precursor [Zea mays]